MEWTVETLKAHFDALREADKQAVSAALAAAEKAVTVAEANAEKWRDNANEWRGAMGDREKDFARRVEVDTAVGNLDSLLGALTTKVERIESVKVGNQESRTGLYALAGFIVSLIVIGGFVVALMARNPG